MWFAGLRLPESGSQSECAMAGSGPGPKRRARCGALLCCLRIPGEELIPDSRSRPADPSALLDLELHLRAFIQGTVAVRLDGQAPFRTPGLTRLPWISGALCRKFAGSPVCPRGPDPPGF